MNAFLEHPQHEQKPCEYCKVLSWLALYCGHSVCGSSTCLNKARDNSKL